MKRARDVRDQLESLLERVEIEPSSTEDSVAIRKVNTTTTTNTSSVVTTASSTAVGTGPTDPAAAGPIIWQTRIFMFALYQFS